MRTTARTTVAVELILVLSAFLLTALITARYQKLITYHEGREWDGVYYYSAAQSFSKGTLPATKSPFVYRVALPFLVARLYGSDLMKGFLHINVIANALALVLLMVWLKFYIKDWRIRVLLAFLFIICFHTGIRSVYQCPVGTDYSDKIWLLAGLIGVHKAWTWSRAPAIAYLCLVTFVGVFFREIVLVIPLALLFINNPIMFSNSKWTLDMGKLPPPIFFLPLLIGLITFASIRFFMVTPTGQYTFARAVLRHLYVNVPPAYVHAWFIAFGPIIVLPIFNWRRSWKFLYEHQFMLVYFGAFAVLAYIGGQTMFRFAYWELPIVFVLIGKAIEDLAPMMRSWLFISILALAQLLSQRAFWVSPDYPDSPSASSPLVIFAPVGNNVRLLDTLGMGPRAVNFISLFEFVAFSGGVLYYLRDKKRTLQLSAVPAMTTSRV